MLIYFFILYSISSFVETQTDPNYLSFNEYSNIEINGVTLATINASQGQQDIFLDLFNIQFNSEELTFPDPLREYSSTEMTISFETNNSGVFEIASLGVNSSDIEIKIGDKIFRIGDLYNVLQPVNLNPSGSIIYKISPESDEFLFTNESYIVISVESGTSRVTRVKLIVMT